MARNEEKQLARLNRFYLQKQREEDLKKRPPRPKLETLTTSEELRKWLPSITRDIEFYVKQMEVTCYRDQHIDEFSRRISHLRGEHKAFLRKLRELEPGNKMTPWNDRPYKMKKYSKYKEDDSSHCDQEADDSITASTQLHTKFTPLRTPVLDNDEQNILNFGYNKHVKVANCMDVTNETMDQPLQFSTGSRSNCSNKCTQGIALQTAKTGNAITSEVGFFNKKCIETERTRGNYDGSHGLGGSLHLPYSDSSSSGDET